MNLKIFLKKSQLIAVRNDWNFEFKKGHLAEDIVIKYLIKLDFLILTRNYYTRYGEIDIVAKKNNILHFIEVKSGKYFNPAENLTDKKLEKLTKAILIYLDLNNNNENYIIDLVTLFNNKIEFFENISF